MGKKRKTRTENHLGTHSTHEHRTSSSSFWQSSNTCPMRCHRLQSSLRWCFQNMQKSHSSASMSPPWATIADQYEGTLITADQERTKWTTLGAMPTGHQCHGHVAHAELASVIVRSVRGHLWVNFKRFKIQKVTWVDGAFQLPFLSKHPAIQMSMSMVTAAILPTPVRPPDCPWMSTSYIATAASRKMKMALKIICSRTEPMRMHKKHFQLLDNIAPRFLQVYTDLAAASQFNLRLSEYQTQQMFKV